MYESKAEEILANMPKGATLYVIERYSTQKYVSLDVFAVVEDRNKVAYPNGDIWFMWPIRCAHRPDLTHGGYKVQKGGLDPCIQLVRDIGQSYFSDPDRFVARKV